MPFSPSVTARIGGPTCLFPSLSCLAMPFDASGYDLDHVIVVRFSKRRLAVLLPLLPALDLKSGKVVAHDPGVGSNNSSAATTRAGWLKPGRPRDGAVRPREPGALATRRRSPGSTS